MIEIQAKWRGTEIDIIKNDITTACCGYSNQLTSFEPFVTIELSLGTFLINVHMNRVLHTHLFMCIGYQRSSLAQKWMKLSLNYTLLSNEMPLNSLNDFKYLGNKTKRQRVPTRVWLKHKWNQPTNFRTYTKQSRVSIKAISVKQ